MNFFSISKIVFLFTTFILLGELLTRIFPPTGLVYKLRDKQVHCIEEWEIPEILLCPNSDTILPHPAGFTFRVRVNEQGERIVSEEKIVPGRNPEVWLMGDSIAYGFGLNDSDTIAWKMQETLQRFGFQVRNLGVDSLGTGGIQRRMERKLICKGPNRNHCMLPKAIFWIYHPSDLQDVYRDFYLKNSLSGRWLFRSSIFLSRYSALYNFFKIKNENRKLENLRKKGPEIIPETLSDYPQDHPSFFEMKTFFDTCKKLNINLTVVLYPNGSHSLTPLTSTPLLDQVAQFADQNGFSVLDTRPDFIREFDQNKTNFYLPNDGHPNSSAARLIADKILESVISKF
ncbi:LA_2486 family SGNH/GDSL-type esterase [Leptospira noguchii]|uniref:LA_2486 family SGNH/GDSL-type esterase n=1 Tax=Leptospira noguchii TaxID=28182 RepID=UPI0011473788|nr:SGNH/GDSL hydrolase family protein [Leptospira noguchii]TQE67883.1 SGNH/GDSL hydrolase family protein [Leptospira noguchii]UOG51432.1 SGNH/GDSL hydrolase family protein [Leptospira noguchii]